MNHATCTAPGCDLPANRVSAQLCEKHYMRVRRHGHLGTLKKGVKPSGRICDVECCDRKAARRSGSLRLCQMHARRVERTGALGDSPVARLIRKARGACTFPGCQSPDDGPHGLCKTHQTRVTRHGDPGTVILPADRATWSAWSPTPTYRAVHQRMRATLGKAAAHPCVGCGAPAAHWSYNHAAIHELGVTDGQPPYSTDARDYSPRCVSCHKRFDMARPRRALV